MYNPLYCLLFTICHLQLLGGKKIVNINLLFHLRLKLLLKKKKTLENLIIKHTPLKLNANTNLKNIGCSRDLFNSFCLLLTRSRCTIIYLFILSLKPHININNAISSIKFQTVLFWQTFWKKKKARNPFTKLLRKEEKERLKFLLRKSRNHLHLYI